MLESKKQPQPKPKSEETDLHAYAKMFKNIPEGRFENKPKKWDSYWRKQWLLWYFIGVVTAPMYLVVLMRFITGRWPAVF